MVSKTILCKRCLNEIITDSKFILKPANNQLVNFVTLFPKNNIICEIDSRSFYKEQFKCVF